MATTSSGYSGTPLPEEVGHPEGSRRRAWCPRPTASTHVLGPLPAGVQTAHQRPRSLRRRGLLRDPPGRAGPAVPVVRAGARDRRWPVGRVAEEDVGRGHRPRLRRGAARRASTPVSSTTRCAPSTAPGRGCASSGGWPTARTVTRCADGSCRCRHRSCWSSGSASRRPRSSRVSPTTTSRRGRQVPIVRGASTPRGRGGTHEAGADDGPVGARAVVGREHRDRRQADQRPGRDHHREGGLQASVRASSLHRPRRRVLRVAAVEEHVDQATAAPAVPGAPARRRADGVRGAVGDLARRGHRRRRRSRRVGALVRDRHHAGERPARARSTRACR